MAYRKFWLINGENETYNLTNIVDSALAINPSGLGANATVSLTRLGDASLANSMQWKLSDISLELLFSNDKRNMKAYDQYKKFLSFTSKLPLYLHYQTPDMIENSYFREVLITSIDKAEITLNTGTLHCPVILTPLTMWKDSAERIIEVVSKRSNGKKYELLRPYHYAGDDIDNIELINNSNVSIPFVLEIEGRCEDPTYSLFDRNSAPYGIGKFLGVFDYVYINSEDLYESIQLAKDGAFLPNAISYQDASVGTAGKTYLTFLYLAPGKNTLKVTFANNFNGKVRIRMRDNYVSV